MQITGGGRKASISKGTYDLFIGNLVSTVVLAIASIIIGRLLGPDGYGLYTVVLVVPAYGYLFLQWGVSSTITRYAAKYTSEGNEKKAVAFSYTILVLHGAASIALFALIIQFTNSISNLLHRPELSGGIIIQVALLAVVGQVLFNNANAAFVGFHSFGKAAILQIINAAARLAISVVFILVGYAVLGAVAGYTIGLITAGVVSFFLLVSENMSFIPRNIEEYVRTTISYAPPVFFSNVVLSAITPLQYTILVYVVSNREIGWYSAASNIAALVTLFTYPLSTALFPLFSKTVNGGTSSLGQAFKQSVKYSALFIIPITVLIMSLATPLVSAIYGNAYQFAGNYRVYLAGLNLLAGVGHVSCGPFLNGVGETRKAFLAAALSTIVSIAASVVLVAYTGVFGVIIGTALGQTVALVISLGFVYDLVKERLHGRSLLRIYFGSGVSAAVIYPLSLLNLNPFVTLFVGTILFILILIPILGWTKALTTNDLIELRGLFDEVKIVRYLFILVGRYRNLIVGE